MMLIKWPPEDTLTRLFSAERFRTTKDPAVAVAGKAASRTQQIRSKGITRHLTWHFTPRCLSETYSSPCRFKTRRRGSGLLNAVHGIHMSEKSALLTCPARCPTTEVRRSAEFERGAGGQHSHLGEGVSKSMFIAGNLSAENTGAFLG